MKKIQEHSSWNFLLQLAINHWNSSFPRVEGKCTFSVPFFFFFEGNKTSLPLIVPAVCSSDFDLK